MTRQPDLVRPLQLGDRAMIEAALAADPMAPSEYCFANLWLFRKRHDYCIGQDPVPHLRGMTYDGQLHAMPLAPIEADHLGAFALQGIRCLYPLASEPAAAEGWTAGWNEDDSDYWFDGDAMAALRFAKPRRSQGIQFRQHAPTFEPWSRACEGEALAVLDGWFADVDRPEAATDHAECREAIEQSSELGLDGGLVRISNGTPVAFLLASRRRHDARVVHFAKGRRACSGAYPWMFGKYAEISGARLLNFEQDLGNPGLAQSKRAYRPMEIRRKWRLYAPG